MATHQIYQVVLTPGFLADLDRIDRFYRTIDQGLANRARDMIAEQVSKLETMPFRYPAVPIAGFEDFREAYVPFGRDGFVVRFALEEAQQLIIVARAYHSREDRYRD